MWEINGVPIHPLVVHAAVVFGPLAALSAIAYSVWGARRDQLRWVTLVLVVVAFLSIWAAFFSGNNFYDSDRFANFRGDAKDKIEHHKSLANTLRWVTTGFFLVTVLAVWQHAKEGGVRYALSALVVVGAVLTLVWVVLTGDAGAKAVWA